MKDSSLFFSLIVGLATLFCVLLILGHDRQDTYIEVGDCVDKTAYEQGFKGSPQEIWTEFAEYCYDRVK